MDQKAEGIAPTGSPPRPMNHTRHIITPPECEAIDRKFVQAGHQPEEKSCDHLHYDFDKHGRHCTCGTVMFDFGD